MVKGYNKCRSIKETKDGVRLSLYIQPRASNSAVVGIYNEMIKIKIAAPPVENEANKELIRFLSRLLKINKQCISIIQGEKGRRKVIEIIGKSRDEVEKLLNLC